MSKRTEVYRNSDQPIVMLHDCDFVKFRITIKEKTETTINGVVEEVLSWDADNKQPSEYGQYLNFYMKWDGCCHLWMGAPGYGGKDQEGVGYFHFCGAKCWEDHIWLLRELWKFAALEIPMDENLEPLELSSI
jgi:hypothetical protein